jgi:hypothetical protein
MSAISSQTTNDALDAVDKYDADSFATILAMLDRRKAGAAAWEPVFRDRGEFGVNALSIAHPTLDPMEHGDFKTADVGNIVTKMRNEATEANLLDTIPYEALKSDRSVRTSLTPSLRPHICPDGSANDWGRCLGGPDACRGWYCVSCGAAQVIDRGPKPYVSMLLMILPKDHTASDYAYYEEMRRRIALHIVGMLHQRRELGC